jgi:hypothetical protein
MSVFSELTKLQSPREGSSSGMRLGHSSGFDPPEWAAFNLVPAGPLQNVDRLALRQGISQDQVPGSTTTFRENKPLPFRADGSRDTDQLRTARHLL